MVKKCLVELVNNYCLTGVVFMVINDVALILEAGFMVLAFGLGWLSGLWS